VVEKAQLDGDKDVFFAPLYG